MREKKISNNATNMCASRNVTRSTAHRQAFKGGRTTRGPAVHQGHETSAQLKAASNGEIRGWSMGPFAAVSRLAPLLKDDSTQLHAQVADEQQQRNANRPPLGALAVDVNVGDREVRARCVRRPAELACDALWTSCETQAIFRREAGASQFQRIPNLLVLHGFSK